MIIFRSISLWLPGFPLIYSSSKNHQTSVFCKSKRLIYWTDWTEELNIRMYTVLGTLPPNRHRNAVSGMSPRLWQLEEGHPGTPLLEQRTFKNLNQLAKIRPLCIKPMDIRFGDYEGGFWGWKIFMLHQGINLPICNSLTWQESWRIVEGTKKMTLAINMATFPRSGNWIPSRSVFCASLGASSTLTSHLFFDWFYLAWTWKMGTCEVIILAWSSSFFEYTPKFNIAPEKWWLEDCFSFGMVNFQGRTVKLPPSIILIDWKGQTGPLIHHPTSLVQSQGEDICLRSITIAWKLKINAKQGERWNM